MHLIFGSEWYALATNGILCWPHRLAELNLFYSLVANWDCKAWEEREPWSNLQGSLCTACITYALLSITPILQKIGCYQGTPFPARVALASSLCAVSSALPVALRQ